MALFINSNLRAGLRSKPTFILNVMAPMANIIIYFEMPSWVKSFDDVKENDEDPEDVKAFKVIFLPFDSTWTIYCVAIY